MCLKDIAVREGEDRREPEGKDSDSISASESPRTSSLGMPSLYYYKNQKKYL